MKSPVILLVNAQIYPLTDPKKIDNALAIQGNRILAIGKSGELLKEFAHNAAVEDMQGRVILPGLADAHIHLQHFALNLQKINCETSTRQECLQLISEKVKSTPPGTWILGHGWNQNNWQEGYGNAQDLDQVASANPVYLTAKSLHAGWTNSLGLRAAGVFASTADPLDGRIGRDPAGNPDGILYETAMDFINKVIPTPSVDAVEKAILEAQPILLKMGLTAVHDFDRRTCFSALQAIEQKGRLQLRVTKSIPLEDLSYIVSLGVRTGFGNDFLRIGSIKAFADGALGPQTAAMITAYENNPENRGILMLDAESLFEYGSQAVRNGLSLAVHAIGDRAVHEVLMGFQQLRELESSQAGMYSKKLRHRIEHVQIIHPEDANLLAEQGIIASMQPIHATSDMKMADRYWGSRAANSYAWKLQLQQGAQLAFGSDAPVEYPNPFWGIHAAVTRQNRDNLPQPGGWFPEQRISVYEAVKAYTSGAAFAANMEDRLGILAPGYLADLIVLEVDPFNYPPDQLHTILPVATMVNGSWIFRNF